ncbi:MAG: 50S ribosomal protein L20 [Bacillota bacterium]
MPRVKTGTITKRRHRKILKLAKGYYGRKSKAFRIANEQVLHALAYARRDRRQRKREFRRLWIVRINAAAREQGITYSRLINGLKKAGVAINRKMLAELAVNDKESFDKLVQIAKESLTA